MRRITALCLTLLLVTTTAILIKAQGRSPLLNRIVKSVKKKEPRWKFVGGVCTCPVLLPSQKSYAYGGWWLGPWQDKRHISIYIAYLPTAEEAAQWMGSMYQWKLGEGWRTEKYRLGDEASFSRDKDGTNSTIYFRKVDKVVEVTGQSRDVERFAKYAVEDGW